MSQENVELLHQAIDAFNRRDIVAFLAPMDPGVEFTARPQALAAAGLSEQAMSQENVEIVRAAYERFNDEAFDRAGEFDLGVFDPDVEVDISSAALDAAVYRGHDGLRQWLSLLRGMWKRQWLEPQEFIPVDEDLVVVPMRIVSLGRYELETVAHAASVWTLRKGKITRVKAFQSKAEALEAVGVREGDSLTGD